MIGTCISHTPLSFKDFVYVREHEWGWEGWGGKQRETNSGLDPKTWRP